jgi:RND family efflux transporter MFP subunit
MFRKIAATLLFVALATPAVAAQAIAVKRVMVDDLKAVIATVEPVHELVARARIGGTIASLGVREGDQVAIGARIATVADQKLLLQMQALQSRIQAQQAERDQAQIDVRRATAMREAGAGTQVALDQARTRLDVAERTLQALRSDRQVVEQQSAEGAVLAPGAGRVLRVPVSEGGVVLPGETIAVIAAENYVLRLQLPERHARFMRAGDTILVGARGLDGTDAEAAAATRQGHVVLVYPQIGQGRVVADVEVDGLGDYFVGERTKVYVATGQRPALVVPEAAVYRRSGVSYVRLEKGGEIPVQVGMPAGGGIEILAGLREGDVVVMP